MPFRFFKSFSSRSLAILACAFLFAVQSGPAQPLDWWTDAPLFGTDATEIVPLLASSPNGRSLIAVCRSAPGGMDLRIGTNSGVSWSAISQRTNFGSVYSVCGNAARAYVCGLGQDGELAWFTFHWNDQSWADAEIEANFALPIVLDPIAVTMFLDTQYQPDEPFLNTVWVEREPATQRAFLRFAQGRTADDPLLTSTDVDTILGVNSSIGELSACASWSGENERLHIAAAIDRPGSIGAGLRLYSSDDQGVHWSSVVTPDSSGSVQSDPAICAFAENVVLFYTRREASSLPAKLYYSYSPDGGLNFAPVDSVSLPFEHVASPRVAADWDSEHFQVVYIGGSFDSTAGTVYGLRGSFATPWELEAPLQISSPNTARFDGGLSLTANQLGMAVAWTSPWLGGDNDVKWDASWRTESIEQRAFIPSAASLSCYPNPFNSMTTISIVLERQTNLSFDLYNELGQRVRALDVGQFSAGNHDIAVDFTGLTSGRYFIQPNLPGPPLRVMLVR